MLVDEDGLVNLDLTCDGIDANLDLRIDYVNNGAVMQPIIDQIYNAVFVKTLIYPLKKHHAMMV